MKSPNEHLYVLVCLGLAAASGLAQSASAQNIVEQRIVINWGVWNWDYYNIHGFLRVGSGVPDGRYYLHFTERNGTNAFSAGIEIINGQPSPAEWGWSDYTYQARFVPDGGWTMAAVSATGIDGPAQGITVPATGEFTVWRLDRYYPDGNVPEAVYKEFDLHVSVGDFPPPTATPPPNNKCVDDKSGGNQENCQSCNNAGMARYSVHSMLVSLNIQDTPLRYSPPRGPAIDFSVTYNQKESQQPAVFSYSNLGPKWTFGWLAYVTDNPAAQLASTFLYVPGGGTEVYQFDSTSQTFSPDPQSHALLVRTGPDSYEKRFPDGSKQIFDLSSGATTYPRKLFMTQMIDPAGNSVLIGYDDHRRVVTITDALGQITTISYQLATDPLKITKVTDPFGRFATFQYEDGKLKTITDAIGIQSQVTYQSGTDSIDSLTTPYGTTTFESGGSGSNRWIEMTDPLGGKERVEYRDGAPGVGASDPVAPSVNGIINAALDSANTFYWDKKAMAVAPGDYTKAKIKHWLYNTNSSVSGILSSEKQPLENRVWYTYSGQPDYQHAGPSANPSQVARVLADGTTQLSQYEYNSTGKTTKATDPAGRILSYIYDPTNNIDVLAVYQRNPSGVSVDTDGKPADGIASNTYNALHEPLTMTDAAGQITLHTYNSSGQLLTTRNAKGETTTYAYGNGTSVPIGYLASITSPEFNGSSAITTFTYDAANRVRTVTNSPDNYTVTTDYDDLDRPTQVTYPNGTNEQFLYTDDDRGMTLDLTASKDRLDRWTLRHYNPNRQMDSITDPLNRTTLYGWCTCGTLMSITDPKGNVTAFNRDLQSRVYQKVFADSTAIDYLFEGQTEPNTAGATSRLKSSTDALNRRTNFSYFIDNNMNQMSYTSTSGDPLNPPTPSVSYTYDPNYNRIATMIDGTGVTHFSYYPVTSVPTLGAGRLQTVDGPLANDTIVFMYDELGRTLGQSIDGVSETVAYDCLGRLTATDDALGHFKRDYDGVTPRLQTLTYPNGQAANYTYYGNNDDRRLHTLENLFEGELVLSKFDYTYDMEGQIMSWRSEHASAILGQWFDYDDARQLLSARDASNPNSATQVKGYEYDAAGNRTGDSIFNPLGQPGNGIFHDYSPNNLNQIKSLSTQVGNLSYPRVELLYDLAGNLTDDGEGKRFEWDAANRLVAVNYTGTTNRSEFTYDGLSRRVKILEKTGSTVTSTKKFVWVGDGIAQERDGNNAITRRYFATGEQRAIPFTRNTQNYYYSRDHLGSIRELTSSTGAVQARYDYDPYGKRTKLSGPLDVDFGYTGHYHHAPSGLDLTLFRAYDSALGRWISRDPIGEAEDLNLYMYVADDPIDRVDPLGLQSLYPPIPVPVPPRRMPASSSPQPVPGGAPTPLPVTTPTASWYGQYCGPGGSGTPIGCLDRACKGHDECYARCGAAGPGGVVKGGKCVRECDRVLCTESQECPCPGVKAKVARSLVMKIFCTTQSLP